MGLRAGVRAAARSVSVRAVRSNLALCALLCFAVACDEGEPPMSDGLIEEPTGDAGTKDAGLDPSLDGGDPDYPCDVAAQSGCDAGSCLLYQQPSGAFGSACFPGACDLVNQDCALGEKCTYVQDGGVSERACSPEGTVEEGSPCALTATSNSCKKGLTCLPRTDADGGTLSVCHRFCESSAGCAGGESCFLTLAPLNNPERPLVCSRPCLLFGQDCPPGNACYPGPTAPGCYPEGTIALGAACAYSDECVKGAACVQQKCVALCSFPSGEPGCAMGTCTQLISPGAPDAGACL